MGTKVEIIADSISMAGKRITTFVLQYPRYIHSEMMTHRTFSKNASSSRAIPMMKIIKQVIKYPVVPIHFGANKTGMSAAVELSGWRKKLAKFLWLGSRWPAIAFALAMKMVGLHKQIGNRILEPWIYMHVILTGTEFDNFYALRCDKDHAHPDIYLLAEMMLESQNHSIPLLDKYHLPYITPAERNQYDQQSLFEISAARCCRISYLNHDKTKPNKEKDRALFLKLAMGGHMSPMEHQASALDNPSEQSGNLVGWKQFRKTLCDETRSNFTRLKKY